MSYLKTFQKFADRPLRPRLEEEEPPAMEVEDAELPGIALDAPTTPSVETVFPQTAEKPLDLPDPFANVAEPNVFADTFSDANARKELALEVVSNAGSEVLKGYDIALDAGVLPTSSDVLNFVKGRDTDESVASVLSASPIAPNAPAAVKAAEEGRKLSRVRTLDDVYTDAVMQRLENTFVGYENQNRSKADKAAGKSVSFEPNRSDKLAGRQRYQLFLQNFRDQNSEAIQKSLELEAAPTMREAERFIARYVDNNLQAPGAEGGLAGPLNLIAIRAAEAANELANNNVLRRIDFTTALGEISDAIRGVEDDDIRAQFYASVNPLERMKAMPGIVTRPIGDLIRGQGINLPGPLLRPALADAQVRLNDVKSTAEQQAAADYLTGEGEKKLLGSRLGVNILREALSQRTPDISFEFTPEFKGAGVTRDDVASQYVSGAVGDEQEQRQLLYRSFKTGIPPQMVYAISAAESPGVTPTSFAYNLHINQNGRTAEQNKQILSALTAIGLDPETKSQTKPKEKPTSYYGADAKRAFMEVLRVAPASAVRGAAFGEFQVLGQRGSGDFLELTKELVKEQDGRDLTDDEAALFAVGLFRENPRYVSDTLFDRWFANNPKAREAAQREDIPALVQEYFGPSTDAFDEKSRAGWIQRAETARKAYVEQMAPQPVAEEQQALRNKVANVESLEPGEVPVDPQGQDFINVVGAGSVSTQRVDEDKVVQSLPDLDEELNYTLIETAGGLVEQTTNFTALPQYPTPDGPSWVRATEDFRNIKDDVEVMRQMDIAKELPIADSFGYFSEVYVRRQVERLERKVAKEGREATPEELLAAKIRGRRTAFRAATSAQTALYWKSPFMVSPDFLNGAEEGEIPVDDLPEGFAGFASLRKVVGSAQIEVLGRSDYNGLVYRQETAPLLLLNNLDALPVYGMSFNIGFVKTPAQRLVQDAMNDRLSLESLRAAVGLSPSDYAAYTHDADIAGKANIVDITQNMYANGVRGVQARANLLEDLGWFAGSALVYGVETVPGQAAMRTALEAGLLPKEISSLSLPAQRAAFRDVARATGQVLGMFPGFYLAVKSPDAFSAVGDAMRISGSALRAFRGLGDAVSILEAMGSVKKAQEVYTLGRNKEAISLRLKAALRTVADLEFSDAADTDAMVDAVGAIEDIVAQFRLSATDEATLRSDYGTSMSAVDSVVEAALGEVARAEESIALGDFNGAKNASDEQLSATAFERLKELADTYKGDPVKGALAARLKSLIDGVPTTDGKTIVVDQTVGLSPGKADEVYNRTAAKDASQVFDVASRFEALYLGLRLAEPETDATVFRLQVFEKGLEIPLSRIGRTNAADLEKGFDPASGLAGALEFYGPASDEVFEARLLQGQRGDKTKDVLRNRRQQLVAFHKDLMAAVADGSVIDPKVADDFRARFEKLELAEAPPIAFSPRVAEQGVLNARYRNVVAEVLDSATATQSASTDARVFQRALTGVMEADMRRGQALQQLAAKPFDARKLPRTMGQTPDERILHLLDPARGFVVLDRMRAASAAAAQEVGALMTAFAPLGRNAKYVSRLKALGFNEQQIQRVLKYRTDAQAIKRAQNAERLADGQDDYSAARVVQRLQINAIEARLKAVDPDSDTARVLQDNLEEVQTDAWFAGLRQWMSDTAAETQRASREGRAAQVAPFKLFVAVDPVSVGMPDRLNKPLRATRRLYEEGYKAAFSFLPETERATGALTGKTAKTRPGLSAEEREAELVILDQLFRAMAGVTNELDDFVANQAVEQMLEANLLNIRSVRSTETRRADFLAGRQRLEEIVRETLLRDSPNADFWEAALARDTPDDVDEFVFESVVVNINREVDSPRKQQLLRELYNVTRRAEQLVLRTLSEDEVILLFEKTKEQMLRGMDPEVGSKVIVTPKADNANAGQAPFAAVVVEVIDPNDARFAAGARYRVTVPGSTVIGSTTPVTVSADESVEVADFTAERLFQADDEAADTPPRKMTEGEYNSEAERSRRQTQRLEAQNETLSKAQVERRDNAFAGKLTPPAKVVVGSAEEALERLEALREPTKVGDLEIRLIPYTNETGFTRRDQIELINDKRLETSGVEARLIDMSGRSDLDRVLGAQSSNPDGDLVQNVGAPIVLVEIDGVRVPFYQSTGKGGKINQSGVWYPVIGLRGGWINKGVEYDIAEYYGSKKLAQVGDYLDNLVGNITGDELLGGIPGQSPDAERVTSMLPPQEDFYSAGRTTSSLAEATENKNQVLRQQYNDMLEALGESPYYVMDIRLNRLMDPDRAYQRVPETIRADEKLTASRYNPADFPSLVSRATRPLLGVVSDAKLAKDTGAPENVVRRYRESLGIEAPGDVEVVRALTDKALIKKLRETKASSLKSQEKGVRYFDMQAVVDGEIRDVVVRIEGSDTAVRKGEDVFGVDMFLGTVDDSDAIEAAFDAFAGGDPAALRRLPAVGLGEAPDSNPKLRKKGQVRSFIEKDRKRRGYTLSDEDTRRRVYSVVQEEDVVEEAAESQKPAAKKTSVRDAAKVQKARDEVREIRNQELLDKVAGLKPSKFIKSKHGNISYFTTKAVVDNKVEDVVVVLFKDRRLPSGDEAFAVSAYVASADDIPRLEEFIAKLVETGSSAELYKAFDSTEGFTSRLPVTAKTRTDARNALVAELQSKVLSRVVPGTREADTAQEFAQAQKVEESLASEDLALIAQEDTVARKARAEEPEDELVEEVEEVEEYRANDGGRAEDDFLDMFADEFDEGEVENIDEAFEDFLLGEEPEAADVLEAERALSAEKAAPEPTPEPEPVPEFDARTTFFSVTTQVVPREEARGGTKIVGDMELPVEAYTGKEQVGEFDARLADFKKAPPVKEPQTLTLEEAELLRLKISGVFGPFTTVSRPGGIPVQEKREAAAVLLAAWSDLRRVYPDAQIDELFKSMKAKNPGQRSLRRIHRHLIGLQIKQLRGLVRLRGEARKAAKAAPSVPSEAVRRNAKAVDLIARAAANGQLAATPQADKAIAKLVDHQKAVADAGNQERAAELAAAVNQVPKTKAPPKVEKFNDSQSVLMAYGKLVPLALPQQSLTTNVLRRFSKRLLDSVDTLDPKLFSDDTNELLSRARRVREDLGFSRMSLTEFKVLRRRLQRDLDNVLLERSKDELGDVGFDAATEEYFFKKKGEPKPVEKPAEAPDAEAVEAARRGRTVELAGEERDSATLIQAYNALSDIKLPDLKRAEAKGSDVARNLFDLLTKIDPGLLRASTRKSLGRLARSLNEGKDVNLSRASEQTRKARSNIGALLAQRDDVVSTPSGRFRLAVEVESEKAAAPAPAAAPEPVRAEEVAPGVEAPADAGAFLTRVETWGATPLAQKATPEQVVAFVDDYLEALSQNRPDVLADSAEVRQFMLNNADAVEAELARRRTATVSPAPEATPRVEAQSPQTEQVVEAVSPTAAEAPRAPAVDAPKLAPLTEEEIDELIQLIPASAEEYRALDALLAYFRDQPIGPLRRRARRYDIEFDDSQYDTAERPLNKRMRENQEREFLATELAYESWYDLRRNNLIRSQQAGTKLVEAPQSVDDVNASLLRMLSRFRRDSIATALRRGEKLNNLVANSKDIETVTAQELLDVVFDDLDIEAKNNLLSSGALEDFAEYVKQTVESRFDELGEQAKVLRDRAKAARRLADSMSGSPADKKRKQNLEKIAEEYERNADSFMEVLTNARAEGLAKASEALQKLTPRAADVVSPDAKAMVYFLNDSSAIIYAMRSADASSGLHEISHILRRKLTRPNQQVLQAWVNSRLAQMKGSNGKTLSPVRINDQNQMQGSAESVVTAEELFATAFEQYLREGVTPNNRLRTVFATMKALMQKIVGMLNRQPTPVDINPAMYQLFDEVFGGVAELRIEHIPSTAQFLGNKRLLAAQEAGDDIPLARIDAQAVQEENAVERFRQFNTSLADYRARGFGYGFGSRALPVQRADGPGLRARVSGPITRRFRSLEDRRLPDAVRDRMFRAADDAAVFAASSFELVAMYMIGLGSDPVLAMRSLRPVMRSLLRGTSRELEEAVNVYSMLLTDFGRRLSKASKARALGELAAVLEGSPVTLQTGAQRGRRIAATNINAAEGFFDMVRRYVDVLDEGSKEALLAAAENQLARMAGRRVPPIDGGGALKGFWQKLGTRSQTFNGDYRTGLHVDEDALLTEIPEVRRAMSTGDTGAVEPLTQDMLQDFMRALTGKTSGVEAASVPDLEGLATIILFYSGLIDLRGAQRVSANDLVRMTGKSKMHLFFTGVSGVTVDNVDIARINGLFSGFNFPAERRSSAAAMLGVYGAVARVTEDTLSLGLGLTAADFNAYFKYVHNLGANLSAEELARARRVQNLYGVELDFDALSSRLGRVYMPRSVRQDFIDGTLGQIKRQLGVGKDALTERALSRVTGFIMSHVLFGTFAARMVYITQTVLDVFRGVASVSNFQTGLTSMIRLAPQAVLNVPIFASVVSPARALETVDALGGGWLATNIDKLRRKNPEGDEIVRNFKNDLRASATRLGDSWARSVTEFFSAAKFRIEVEPIMEADSNVVFDLGGTLYRASDLRRIFARSGMYSNPFKLVMAANRAASRDFLTGSLYSPDMSNDNRKFVTSVSDSMSSYLDTNRGAAMRGTRNLFSFVMEHGVETTDAMADVERTGVAISLIERGMAPEYAARVVVEGLYDYRGSMTSLDRNVFFRLAMPFFAFRKNAVAHTINMMTSPRGVFMIRALERLPRMLAPAATTVLYEAAVGPYGLDTSAMNPLQRDLYYSMRSYFELGLGEDASEEDLNELRKQLPEDQRDMPREELLQYDFNGWTALNGYGDYTFVPSDVRLAVRGLIANNSEMRSEGVMNLVNDTLFDPEARAMFARIGSGVVRPDPSLAGAPDYAVQRYPTIQMFVPQMTPSVQEAVAQGTVPSFYLSVPDSMMFAAFEHIVGTMAFGAVAAKSAYFAAKGEYTEAETDAMLNSIESVIDFRGVGGPVPQELYDIIRNINEDDVAYMELHPYMARRFEGTLGMPPSYEGTPDDAGVNLRGLSATTRMMLTQLADVPLPTEVVGRMAGVEVAKEFKAARLAKVVVRDGKRELQYFDRLGEYVAPSGDAVYKPFLVGMPAIIAKYAPFGIINGLLLQADAATSLEELAKIDEELQNVLMSYAVSAARKSGFRVFPYDETRTVRSAEPKIPQ